MVVLAAVSCVNIQKLKNYPSVQAEVTDKYLQEYKGNLDVDMDILVPEEFRSWHTGLKMVPVIEGEGDMLVLDPLVVEGVVHNKMNDRFEWAREDAYDGTPTRVRYAKRNNATEVDYHTTVPYEPWMDMSDLYIDIWGDAYTKEVYLGRIYAASGVFSMKQFMEFDPVLKYYFYTDQRDRHIVTGGVSSMPVDVSVIFPVNSSKINKKQLAEIDRFFNGAKGSPAFLGAEVDVHVQDSPEGSYKLNEKLGDKRAAAVRNYLESIGIKDNIDVTIEVEAWTELIQKLEESTLQNKAAMLDIARSNEDPDIKSYRLRQYYKDYNTILNTIYPDLRRADISVDMVNQGEQGQLYEYLMKEQVAKCEGREVASFAKVSDDADYEAAHRKMLDAILAGDKEQALTYADQIPTMVQSPVITWNKAVLYTETGKYREAKHLFSLVSCMPYADYNKGLLELNNQEYAAASKDLSQYVNINSGIAKLYAGDNEGAIDVLSVCSKTANRDYLLAIAYARQSDTDNMMYWLDSAVSKDSTLKARAYRETDFAPWRETRQFNEILK